MVTIDFDFDGEWDEEQMKGPAIHVPDDIKGIIVDKYRIEWLDMSTPDFDFYAKNHIVAAVDFATPQMLGNTIYRTARISMEIEVNARAGDTVPGVLEVNSIYTRQI